MAALKQRKPVKLTRPMAPPQLQEKARRAGEIACDEVLFDRLRQLRKRLADERDVPAYIVFSDVALRQMARECPGNEREFARISGVGEKKLREFGNLFLAEIGAHLQTNPRQIFADDSFTTPVPAKSRLSDTVRETLRRFRAGESVDQIAASRMLVIGTVYGHLAEALQCGERLELSRLFTSRQQEEVAAAFARVGFGNLTGVFVALGGAYDYAQLRVFRAAQNAARRV
jgi:ATP-dependent DNA helicase RecQ